MPPYVTSRFWYFSGTSNTERVYYVNKTETLGLKIREDRFLKWIQPLSDSSLQSKSTNRLSYTIKTNFVILLCI